MDLTIQKKIEIQKEAEEAHEIFNAQSICSMSVGLGKSVLAINRIVKKYKENENANILFTSARELYGENFKKELIKFNHDYLLNKIDIICNRSLENELFYSKPYDIIIIDECHKEISIFLPFIKHQLSLNKNIEILGLTGTPKYGQDYNELYNYLPISYKKQIDSAIKDDLLNNYKIHILFHELSNNNSWVYRTKKYNKLFSSEKEGYRYLYNMYINSEKKGFDWILGMLKVFFKTLKSKEDYAKIIIDKFLPNDKILVYAGSIEQSEKMGYPTYHSALNKKLKNENFDNFFESKERVLINVDSIKESVSIPDLKYGIIMKIDASTQSFEQTIGRFLRLSVSDISHIFVLCAKNTIEEKWLQKAIKKLNKKQIFYYEINDLIEKKLKK